MTNKKMPLTVKKLRKIQLGYVCMIVVVCCASGLAFVIDKPWSINHGIAYINLGVAVLGLLRIDILEKKIHKL